MTIWMVNTIINQSLIIQTNSYSLGLNKHEKHNIINYI